MHHTDYLYMLKLLVLTLVILTTLTVNPYLTSQVESSSSDGSDDEGDEVGEEPPTLMERRGDPIPDVDVSLCGKYKYYDSKLKKCVPLPKEGIEASNTTTAATSELINQSGLINNNNSTEGDLIIREEGTPSGPSSPQPKPSPSPKPC